MIQLTVRERMRMLDEYVEAFSLLAQEESVECLSPSKLRAALSRYSIEDIERVYDACCRFGMNAMMMTNRSRRGQ